MRNVLRMNVNDPPPDLAIEVDVTSTTKFDAYQALAVSELWIYNNGVLKIYLLTEEMYVESELSPIFGNLPVRKVIPNVVEQNLREGRKVAMLSFKSLIAELNQSKP